MPTPVKWSTADFELADIQDPEGEPWLAATPNGRFTLSYFETFDNSPVHTDIETKLYSAAGVDMGLGVNVTVSALWTEHQPASAYLPDGRQVCVWTERPNGVGGLGLVHASVYVADNLLSIPDFLVNAGAGPEFDPVVAAGRSGFAIALIDSSVAGGRLILKFYNLAGNLVNTSIAPDAPQGVSNPAGAEGLYRDLEITALANGNYVVTWGDESDSKIWARVFAGDGTAVGGFIDIEPGGANAGFPDVTALADGRFLITYDQYSVFTVRGRIFEADGAPSTGPFTIATNAINTVFQQVQSAALRDGRFVTVWVNFAGNIEGQVLKADGTPDGAAFAVNGDGAGNKGRPVIATLADGRFVVSWESGAGATATIFSTIFDPREVGLYRGATSLDDDWHGTDFSDTAFMGPGDDQMSADQGIDFIHGEDGRDTLFGDAGADRLYGGNDDDTLNGGADGDFLYGGLGSDTLNGEAGTDSAYGQDGNDTLNGGSEADTLDGGNGNDTLNGGSENDILRGRAGNDIINGGSENDDARGGNGDDTINGEDGDDTFLAGEASIDTISGGLGNDRIDGGADGDILSGDAGSDNITGGLGNDTIDGGDNDDGNGLGILQGLDGDDTISGGSGIDRLEGGNNNDRLIGGIGNDVLLGGSGLDDFVFTDDTEGNDRIDDWTAVDDQLEIDASAFGGGLAAGALAANRLVVAAAPVANQAFGQFLYNTGSGQLSWDADGTGAGAAVQIARLLSGGVAVGTLAVGDFDIVA
jgi:Ca2+-binding RTX toxin-like protein